MKDGALEVVGKGVALVGAPKRHWEPFTPNLESVHQALDQVLMRLKPMDGAMRLVILVIKSIWSIVNAAGKAYLTRSFGILGWIMLASELLEKIGLSWDEMCF